MTDDIIKVTENRGRQVKFVVNNIIMKKELKKVETFDEKYDREDMENREELFRAIKSKPGVMLDELVDSYTGLGVYGFLQDMMFLFEERDVVDDCGQIFPDEITRQKMAKEGWY